MSNESVLEQINSDLDANSGGGFNFKPPKLGVPDGQSGTNEVPNGISNNQSTLGIPNNGIPSGLSGIPNGLGGIPVPQVSGNANFNSTPLGTFDSAMPSFQQQDIGIGTIQQTSAGLAESIDNMFSAIIIGGMSKTDPNFREKIEVFKKSLNLFLSKFPSNLFENEYAFLYECIGTLKVKIFTRQMLETLIEQNGDEILGSPLINLSMYSLTNTGSAVSDSEKLQSFKLDVIDKFNYLSNRCVSFEEFESACSLFVKSFKDKLMTETVQNMVMIMSTGYVEKRSGGRSLRYYGYEDARKYYMKQMRLIDELEEENFIRSTKIDENWLAQEYTRDSGVESDIMIGIGIDEVDAAHGKLHRGNIIQFLGAPKGGKTTMATALVDDLLDEGYNVAVWPLEGEVSEWTALLQSLMVRKNANMYIDKKRVYERDFKDDDERQAVMYARQRMATDPNRGRLSFIEGVCYVENMVEVLQDHYDNENAFDVIVMDSPVLVLSKTGKPKTERIAEAFVLLKNFVSNKMRQKALAITTAQLKQTVVDKIRANPKERMDVTSGGDSAETIRSVDYAIGLFSSEEERALQQIKIYDVATRHGAQFPPTYIHAELGCGFFCSDPALNNG